MATVRLEGEGSTVPPPPCCSVWVRSVRVWPGDGERGRRRGRVDVTKGHIMLKHAHTLIRWEEAKEIGALNNGMRKLLLHTSKAGEIQSAMLHVHAHTLFHT